MTLGINSPFQACSGLYNYSVIRKRKDPEDSGGLRVLMFLEQRSSVEVGCGPPFHLSP